MDWAPRPALHGSAELDLVGDHFAGGALGPVLFIFGSVQVADDGQLLALLDMLGDGCSQAVEAGSASIALSTTVLQRPGCCRGR